MFNTCLERPLDFGSCMPISPIKPPNNLLVETLDLKFSSLITQPTNGQRRWEVKKLETLFSPQLVAEILKITLSPNPYLDKWLWTEKKNGIFRFKVPIEFCPRRKMVVWVRVPIGHIRTGIGKTYGK